MDNTKCLVSDLLDFFTISVLCPLLGRDIPQFDICQFQCRPYRGERISKSGKKNIESYKKGPLAMNQLVL